MLKFLDQSFGALVIGMFFGCVSAYVGFTVDTIREVVPPVALALYATFSVVTAIVLVRARAFGTLKLLAKLTATFFFFYFAISAVTTGAEVNEQAAAMLHVMFLVVPWVAVAVSLVFMLVGFGEAAAMRQGEKANQDAAHHA
jgi:ABC-type dipeptide/oligopeptide/nickel transport system permease subunit